jgi:hypothetical protein
MNRSEGQWEQLAMYMTAPEIKNKYSVHVEEMEDSNVTDEGTLWNKKLKESRQRSGNPKSRYEIFKKEGVQSPVEIGYSRDYPEGYIGEGHHRVASMEKIDPNKLIPVTHDYEGPIKFRGTF